MFTIAFADPSDLRAHRLESALMDTTNSLAYVADLLLLSLPASLILNRIRSEVLVETTLTLLGLYLVFLVGPRYALFWLTYWTFTAAMTALLGRIRSAHWRQVVLWTSLAVLLTPMLAWKVYGDRFVSALNDAMHVATVSAIPAFSLIENQVTWIVPVGLSFSTFRAMDFVIKRYLELYGTISLRRVLFYGFFPPVLIVGPIIQFDEVDGRAHDADRVEWRKDYAAALGRFLVGGAKIFVLSAPFATSQSTIVDYSDHTTGEVWTAALLFSLYLYVNFSGFSDLSIGAARMFGYRLRENFSMPFLRPNLQELWANFHMSLTGWAQRNVFVPLGGYRRETQYRAVFLTMMVVALWHGVNLSLVVFGVLHASLLVYLRMRPRETEPGPIGYLARCFGTYVFFSLTLPLYLLPFDRVMGFYASLAGWSGH